MKKTFVTLLTTTLFLIPKSFAEDSKINISDVEKKLDKLKDMHALECSPEELGKLESYLQSLKQDAEKDKQEQESKYIINLNKKRNIDYLLAINNLLSKIENNIYSDKDKDGIPCYKEIELGLNPDIPDKREEKVALKEEKKQETPKNDIKEKPKNDIKENKETVKEENNSINQPVRVHFYTNKADIKKEYLPYLNIVAKYIKTHPNIKIKVVGYTDNVGPKSYNQKLALKRAESVKNYLIKLGVDPNRIVITGRGKEDYIVSNSKELDRFTNRRAEFYIINLTE